MGLEILEPGMKKLKLVPSLMGLENARTELLTPYGKIVCKQCEGEAPVVSVPQDIEIILC